VNELTLLLLLLGVSKDTVREIVAEDFLTEEDLLPRKRARTESPVANVLSHNDLLVRDDKPEPFVNDDVSASETSEERDFKDVVRRHWGSIMTYHKCQKIVDILNVRLWDPENETAEVDVEKYVIKTWNSFQCRAKVNVSLGCVLQHKTNGRFRYFHSSSNNWTLYQSPVTISSESDLESFMEDVTAKDLASESIRRRPDTNWKLYAVSNMTFYFYKLLDMSRVGHVTEKIRLPKHILSNRSVFTLHVNPKSGKPYNDKLCFFRCLAVLTNCVCAKKKCACKTVSEKTAKKLADTYLMHRGISMECFEGVDERDLLTLEDLFNVSIHVFVLGKDRMATVVWRSKRTFAKRLNLNLSESHFSYIRNLDSYTNTYSCSVCKRCFAKLSNYTRHSCAVENASKLAFKGGEFCAPRNVFDRLEREAGVVLDKSDPLRYYPYRITFDIESLLSKDPELLPTDTETTTYDSYHSLLSVSVCSNVPNYKKPRCFVRDSNGVEACVEKFVNYLHEVAESAELILTAKYK
jgi:hypothetical protein